MTETLENARCAPPEFGDVRQFLIERDSFGKGLSFLPVVVWVTSETKNATDSECDPCEVVYRLTLESLNYLAVLAGKPPRTSNANYSCVCACMGRLIE